MLDEDGRRRLEAAYRGFGGEVWSAVLAYCGGRRDVADEAVAEAFAQAGRRLGAIADLRPWVFRAAFRIAAGEMGRMRRGRQLEDASVSAPAVTDGWVEIEAEVRRLSPRQRRVFVLRDVFGYSTRETAELLGTSEVGVRVHLHAARRRLRDLLLAGGEV